MAVHVGSVACQRLMSHQCENETAQPRLYGHDVYTVMGSTVMGSTVMGSNLMMPASLHTLNL